MNCTTGHALHKALSQSAFLATAVLLPLSWSSQVNADIFGALKEAAEKLVEQEIEKAIDGDKEEQQPTQAVPTLLTKDLQLVSQEAELTSRQMSLPTTGI